MVLEKRSDDPRKGETRAVQCVNETRLPAFSRAISDIASTRLIVSETAARGNLQPCAYTGRKDLEIIGLRAAEPRVARGEKNTPVRKLEKLQDFFRVSSEQLQLIIDVSGVE